MLLGLVFSGIILSAVCTSIAASQAVIHDEIFPIQVSNLIQTSIVLYTNVLLDVLSFRKVSFLLNPLQPQVLLRAYKTRKSTFFQDSCRGLSNLPPPSSFISTRKTNYFAHKGHRDAWFGRAEALPGPAPYRVHIGRPSGHEVDSAQNGIFTLHDRSTQEPFALQRGHGRA